jgi:hypothetical protein
MNEADDYMLHVHYMNEADEYMNMVPVNHIDEWSWWLYVTCALYEWS